MLPVKHYDVFLATCTKNTLMCCENCTLTCFAAICIIFLIPLSRKEMGDTMPVSATKRRNNDNYNAKCDAITIRPLKATGTAIRAAAAAAGQSLQGYILQAVRARMEQEGQPLEIDPAESGEEGGL